MRMADSRPFLCVFCPSVHVKESSDDPVLVSLSYFPSILTHSNGDCSENSSEALLAYPTQKSTFQSSTLMSMPPKDDMQSRTVIIPFCCLQYLMISSAGFVTPVDVSL